MNPRDHSGTPSGGSGPPLPPWKDLILIGKITRTQGHRGAVRLHPEFEPLNRFEGLKSDELIIRLPATGAVLQPEPVSALRPSDPARILHVEDFSYHQQFVILTFVEVEDMTAAEKLRGAQVYVRPEDIWDLEEGEFFAHEILGFAVVDEESGRKLGTIRTVQSGAAHDFLLVKRETGKGEFPIPMVKELVRLVDKEGRQVLVSLPEGLEEL